MGMPRLIVLDVNETLSDLSPMGERFADVGAPATLARTWFASSLRDGFALSVVGENPDFAALLSDNARILLAGLSLTSDADAAVEHVMAGFGSLSLHPDVAPALAALADLGIRLVTLTNGGTSVAETLFENAGVSDRVEMLLSVEDAPAWKPAASAYEYALTRCDVRASEAMLVAVHPWDIDGAARAGLRTAWIDRAGSSYPKAFREPELTAAGLVDLAEQLR